MMVEVNAHTYLVGGAYRKWNFQTLELFCLCISPKTPDPKLKLQYTETLFYESSQ